jgi:hypothetical protein
MACIALRGCVAPTSCEQHAANNIQRNNAPRASTSSGTARGFTPLLRRRSSRRLAGGSGRRKSATPSNVATTSDADDAARTAGGARPAATGAAHCVLSIAAGLGGARARRGCARADVGGGYAAAYDAAPPRASPPAALRRLAACSLERHRLRAAAGCARQCERASVRGAWSMHVLGRPNVPIASKATGVASSQTRLSHACPRGPCAPTCARHAARL